MSLLKKNYIILEEKKKKTSRKKYPSNHTEFKLWKTLCILREEFSNLRRKFLIKNIRKNVNKTLWILKGLHNSVMNLVKIWWKFVGKCWNLVQFYRKFCGNEWAEFCKFYENGLAAGLGLYKMDSSLDWAVYGCGVLQKEQWHCQTTNILKKLLSSHTLSHRKAIFLVLTWLNEEQALVDGPKLKGSVCGFFFFLSDLAQRVEGR